MSVRRLAGAATIARQTASATLLRRNLESLSTTMSVSGGLAIARATVFANSTNAEAIVPRLERGAQAGEKQRDRAREISLPLGQGGTNTLRGQGLVRRVEARKQRVDDPFGIFRVIILATKSIE